MIKRVAVIAGLFAGAIAFTPQTASAAPLASYPSSLSSAVEGTLVEQVQWGRCRYWRRECAARWGWRTPQWYACMARHGC